MTTFAFPIKCMACSLHFIVYSWHEDFIETRFRFCPECGEDSVFIVFKEEKEEQIYQFVPGKATSMAILKEEKMPSSGDRVRLKYMEGETGVPPGTEGTVTMIDGANTIHVQWDNGRNLGLIVGTDEWEDITWDTRNPSATSAGTERTPTARP